jgi:protein ImuB
MNKPAELYACLYAKEFPAQALLRLRPELRNKPCVVMEGEPPLEQVCSRTAKARALGLAQGMTRVEVDTFSAVTVLSRSQHEEAAAKAVLLECAGGFSPRVEERSEGNVFLCAVDIAGTKKLFGPPETLAAAFLSRVRSLGITACVAVSANFHAAAALAKGLSLRSPIAIVPAGEECASLAPLPLSVLDLSEEHAEIFSSWGIGTLGMLAALPEQGLIARLGQAGKRLRQLARGEMPHLFQPVEPPFTLEERMELESPVEVLDALLFAVNVMLEQLILRAAARVLALASVTIALALEGGVAHSRSVRPALPTNDRQLWIKLLHLDLEAHPPNAAILSIALNAEPGSTGKVQLGLFSPQLPEPSRLDVTLARIRAIVGDENAGCAVLKDSHEPDGFRMEPFRIPPEQRGNAQPANTHPMKSDPRPLRPAMRWLRPPETVRVVLDAQRPNTFVFRERRHVVERAYGPWLKGGAWWGAGLWGCEQWDVIARAENGPVLCCCLVRDLLHDRWQMAGLYD